MNCTKFSGLQRYSFFGDRPPVVKFFLKPSLIMGGLFKFRKLFFTRLQWGSRGCGLQTRTFCASSASRRHKIPIMSRGGCLLRRWRMPPEALADAS